MGFVHLHNHTQYSMLDGACRVDKMVKRAVDYGMPAVAMTDHGNMFGTIDFYNTAKKHGIKPIIGIETYIINGDIKDPKFKNAKKYHLVILAKNLKGYKNLIKLSSKAFTDGFYYKPRIDKNLLAEYSEGLIVLTACIQGEISQLLLHNNKEEALEAIHFYKTTFGEDFYIEIQDHNLEDEKKVMPKLIEIARETNTPLVVTNDAHYLDKADAEAHDILLCIQTGKSYNDPNRMRYVTDELYFKTEAEMRRLFPHIPEAYENTIKIADKIDVQLDYKDFIFPVMDVPPEYKNQADWLRQLCLEGAKTRYPEITDEIMERLDFELDVINKMGYNGYFLIVKDFIDAARAQSIPVGPGRGSAAGSIVAYLTGITQLDPLKYGLLFERFLDVERQGMPDIDIDFCAKGRNKVIDYVVEKYGRESVTQIITFGTLGAKSVIKDVARVLEVPPAEANKITKLMPTGPKVTIESALQDSKEFADYMNSNDLYKTIIRYGMVLEGLIRQTGIHAAGVVIGPDDLSNYVPLAVSTQKNGKPAVLVQYEGKWLDDLKLLKMDFLGLKTLTLIDQAKKLIKESKGIDVDIDNVALDDKETYALLSEGATDGVFQFESAGMKKYLIELQPNVFEDLIAMVALYRPGPMDFISTFINRKHGKEKVEYDHDLTKKSLQETYGVTVYQEQVMQISKDMAGFTSAQAGKLRKAISKKKIDMLESLYKDFEAGSIANGVPKETVEKIWEKWLSFANYAFNKSHAACYAFIAYQTAYLKAHYPVEFMAALLSLEDDPAKIPYFLEECRNMNIDVVPPNINQSMQEFAVRDNKILFGLRGIKNVGNAAINSILNERDENGPFKNIFEFARRVDTMSVNKAVIESLVYAGALDELPGTRGQQFATIEDAIGEASTIQNIKKGGGGDLFDIFEKAAKEKNTENTEENIYKKLKDVEDWSFSKKLEHEKDILGFYVSGHPLMKHHLQIELFSNYSTKDLGEGNPFPSEVRIFGIVDKVSRKRTRRGDTMAIVSFEDLYGKFEVTFYRDQFDEYIQSLQEGKEFLIIGFRNDFNNDDRIIRLKPKKLIGIDELRYKLSGNLIIELEEESIDKELIDYILSTFNNTKGKFNVNFKIHTKKFNTLKFHSQSLTVFPDENILEKLEKNTKINYILELGS